MVAVSCCVRVWLKFQPLTIPDSSGHPYIGNVLKKENPMARPFPLRAWPWTVPAENFDSGRFELKTGN
jgi:hypothetical protein